MSDSFIRKYQNRAVESRSGTRHLTPALPLNLPKDSKRNRNWNGLFVNALNPWEIASWFGGSKRDILFRRILSPFEAEREPHELIVGRRRLILTG